MLEEQMRQINAGDYVLVSENINEHSIDYVEEMHEYSGDWHRVLRVYQQELTDGDERSPYIGVEVKHSTQDRTLWFYRDTIDAVSPKQPYESIEYDVSDMPIDYFLCD